MERDIFAEISNSGSGKILQFWNGILMEFTFFVIEFQFPPLF